MSYIGCETYNLRMWTLNWMQKKVVDYYNGGHNDISEFGAIIENCRRRCQAHFPNSKIEFSRRQINEVVHTLARKRPFF